MNASRDSGSPLSRRSFLQATAAAAVAVPAAPLTRTANAADAPAPRPTAKGRPILLKGGTVLTLDRQLGDFEKADVLVDGTRIAAVRPSISAPNAEVIDASQTIVMPGFV